MNDRSGDNIVGDGLCAVPFAMDGIVFSLLAIAKVRRPLSRPMAASSPKRGAKRARSDAMRQCKIFAAKRCPYTKKYLKIPQK